MEEVGKSLLPRQKGRDPAAACEGWSQSCPAAGPWSSCRHDRSVVMFMPCRCRHFCEQSSHPSQQQVEPGLRACAGTHHLPSRPSGSAHRHHRHQHHKNFGKSRTWQKVGLEGHQPPQKGEQPRTPKGCSQQCFPKLSKTTPPSLGNMQNNESHGKIPSFCPVPQGTCSGKTEQAKEVFSKHKLKSY